MEQLLFTKYANRFSIFRKKQFRNAIILHLQANNINVQIDKGIYGKNIMFGNLDSEYVFTAHYDTATNMRSISWLLPLFGNKYGQVIAVVLLLLTTLISFKLYMLIAFIFFVLLLIPNKYNFNDNSSGILTLLRHAKQGDNHLKYMYVLTDNEEKGLFGGRLLKKYMNKNIIHPYKVINVDCVGFGDEFIISCVTASNFLNDAVTCANLVTPVTKVHSKILSSDHLHFGQNGIMISRVNKAKFVNDYYIPNIHTNDDREINPEHIDTTLLMIDKIIKNTN